MVSHENMASHRVRLIWSSAISITLMSQYIKIISYFKDYNTEMQLGNRKHFKSSKIRNTAI